MHALLRPTRLTLAMMTDKNGLAHVEGLRELVGAPGKGIGLRMSLVGKIFEPIGLDGGALGQRHFFGLDLTGQFDGEVFALRRPFRCHEQLLFRSPFEARFLDTGIGLGIEAGRCIEADLVVLRAVCRGEAGH